MSFESLHFVHSLQNIFAGIDLLTNECRNDCVLMNWRKLASWDLLIDEIREWAKRGVNGVRLDNAQSWPLILKPDNDELMRG